MAKKVVFKKVKIKPENEAVAEGVVEECNFTGTSRVGIGPIAKVTLHFKAFIKVEGVEKPLVLKIKFKQGWGLGIYRDIQAAGNIYSGELPIDIGEVVKVSYDRIKPKKCNIIEE